MSATDLDVTTRGVLTHDGWSLRIKRTAAPGGPGPGTRPVLIVPGYGMNSFIFGFHPHGTSMERALAEAGLEVWTMDLRRSGGSRPTRPGASPPSLRAYAEIDLTAALDHVLESTSTGAGRVDVIGGSLGGSIVYAHLALVPRHRVGSVVAIGAPLRWDAAHPALRLAFRSPAVAGAIPLAGTRTLARLAFPLLTRSPWLLAPYMNTAHVDLRAAGHLTRTVEDPHPRVNRDIAYWINARDMVLRGVNVTEAMGRVTQPLLVVLANRDGIVPAPAALSARAAWGGPDVEVLRVGDDKAWYAHADLFVGNHAPRVVFDPLARWLLARHAA